MNEGKRPKVCPSREAPFFSSVSHYLMRVFFISFLTFTLLQDTDLFKCDFFHIIVMATFQFLFCYSFFASSLLLHALALFVEVEENNVALASSQKTSVVKLLDFFQLFMALKVNVTVSLLILQRLILRLLKTETTGCQSKF